MSLITANVREAVAHRARNRCEYCHLSQDSQVATFPVDHIIPVSLSGLTELDNLALACPRCNAQKWKHVEAPDAETGQMVPLFNPRVHPWTDHFRWSQAGLIVLEGITVTGRATVRCLELNSAKHLAIRTLLRMLSLHPPVADVSS